MSNAAKVTGQRWPLGPAIHLWFSHWGWRPKAGPAGVVEFAFWHGEFLSWWSEHAQRWCQIAYRNFIRQV